MLPSPPRACRSSAARPCRHAPGSPAERRQPPPLQASVTSAGLMRPRRRDPLLTAASSLASERHLTPRTAGWGAPVQYNTVQHSTAPLHSPTPLPPSRRLTRNGLRMPTMSPSGTPHSARALRAPNTSSSSVSWSKPLSCGRERRIWFQPRQAGHERPKLRLPACPGPGALSNHTVQYSGMLYSPPRRGPWCRPHVARTAQRRQGGRSQRCGSWCGPRFRSQN